MYFAFNKSHMFVRLNLVAKLMYIIYVKQYHRLLLYQGPVVQSWVSTNSGLRFNPMFRFLCFYISVYFKTLQTKTNVDPDKIS